MSALLALADDIAADRRITPDEAVAMRKEIFPDGVVSRQEADVLVSLNGQVEDFDDAWMHAFVEAIGDYALSCGAHVGHVDGATTAWLAANLGSDALSVETLLKLVERAESVPDELMEFTRTQVAFHVSGKPMDAVAVELVRRALYASGGAGGVSVEADELDWLFSLDAEADGRANDPAWQDLFVKAGLCHVVGRRAPVLLEQEAMMASATHVEHHTKTSVFDALRGIMAGGLAGYRQRINEADEFTALEERYENINAEVDEDSKLTAEEAASILGIANRDGKLTSNEQALMDELKKLEADQAAEWAVTPPLS